MWSHRLDKSPSTTTTTSAPRARLGGLRCASRMQTKSNRMSLVFPLQQNGAGLFPPSLSPRSTSPVTITLDTLTVLLPESPSRGGSSARACVATLRVDATTWPPRLVRDATGESLPPPPPLADAGTAPGAGSPETAGGEGVPVGAVAAAAAGCWSGVSSSTRRRQEGQEELCTSQRPMLRRRQR